MIEKEKYNKIKNFLQEYLELKGINTNKLFRCVNKNHEDKNPSMAFYKNKNICKCFGCGQTYNIFQIIGLEYGVDNFYSQLKIAENLYDHREKITNMDKLYSTKTTIGNYQGKEDINKKTIVKNNNLSDSKKRYGQYVLKCKKEINKTDYLLKRGISKEVIEKNNIGYDENFKNGEWKALIIPTGWGSITARNTDSTSKDRIRKIGNAAIFNYWKLKNKEPFFIVEGEIDALSIETLGENAISLGSVNNIQLLMKKFEEDKVENKFYLMLDNDEVGRKTQKELLNLMKKANIKVYETNSLGQYKDINEYLINEPEKCKKIIKNIALVVFW